MKTHKKTRAAIILAILLAAALTTAAASGSVLSPVYDAGKALLFDTDNVTLNGNAYFSLDSELFKTVNAKYVQDGVNSIWDYQLISPLRDGSGDRESGYTVYANGEPIFTVDRSYPGTFRNGFGEAQNTLVRRSAQMDQIVDLAGAALACMEPLLPQGAVEVVTENHTGKTVRVTLEKSSISDLTNTVFNLCTQMAISRAIEPVDFDILPYTYSLFRDYFTPAKAIISCTERYNLDYLDATVTLDGNGRLRALDLGMTVILDLAEECVTADEPAQHRLDVTLSVKVSDYGTSKVAAFDPEAEGLKPQWTYYE